MADWLVYGYVVGATVVWCIELAWIWYSASKVPQQVAQYLATSKDPAVTAAAIRLGVEAANEVRKGAPRIPTTKEIVDAIPPVVIPPYPTIPTLDEFKKAVRAELESEDLLLVDTDAITAQVVESIGPIIEAKMATLSVDLSSMQPVVVKAIQDQITNVLGKATAGNDKSQEKAGLTRFARGVLTQVGIPAGWLADAGVTSLLHDNPIGGMKAVLTAASAAQQMQGGAGLFAGGAPQAGPAASVRPDDY